MTFNSESIVQEIRSEFESLISKIETDESSSADEIERTLLRELLNMGLLLLSYYFSKRGSVMAENKIWVKNGQELPTAGMRTRKHFSIFGRLSLRRPYFYKKGIGGTSPLDAELGLDETCYSDLVRELNELLGVEVAYEKAVSLFERIVGQPISSSAVQSMVATDAAEVRAYYEQKAAPLPATEETLLVLQADGKGVPLVRTEESTKKVRLGKGEKRAKKKESIVTALYTVAPRERTPKSVIQSLFHPEQESSEQKTPTETGPKNKQLWATLDGKDAALERLKPLVQERIGTHIQHRIALADGCEALQKRMQEHFPDFLLILDFIHANEYIWKAATALFGEKDKRRNPWVETQASLILSGKTQSVIDEFRRLIEQPKRTKKQRIALTKSANYFERNLAFMRYDSYLKNGWPIASGVIEGACRHFVKDRFECSGMRWTQTGAEALLQLRAVSINGDWDDFHAFRKQCRQLRLYGSQSNNNYSPEMQALSAEYSSDEKIISFPRPAVSLAA